MGGPCVRPMGSRPRPRRLRRGGFQTRPYKTDRTESVEERADTRSAPLRRTLRRKHVLNVALNRWIMGLSRKLRVLSQAHYAKHKHSMPSTRREPMHNSLGLRFLLCAAAAAITLSGSNAFAQQPYGPNDAPNIHKFTYGWAQFPDRRKFGAVVGVDIDRDGKSVWAFDRCESATDCSNSNLDPIMKFNQDGKLLMTLGKPGVAGTGTDVFSEPSDIYVVPNGDIFVADGHGGPQSNHRMLKFDKDGKFIKQWGKKGWGPGEFNVPHNIAMDSIGRLFVADRSNNRIQIFDQEGKYLDEWRQFGRPSGLFIDKNDMLYVADSSADETNPPYRAGIRIGSARDGVVRSFILESVEVSVEGIAADDAGNVYGGNTNQLNLRRWAPKNPPKS